MKKIISILTATRAEYGLLKPIIKKLSMIEEFDVRIVVTGMHLTYEFGMTYQEIEEDGFNIHKKIDILKYGNTSVGISKAMGQALFDFADYFETLKPDLLLVLGDRYETLAVCCTAMNARIPIAHLYGGETTEGAIDEAIRHAITKMSYIHFTSTAEYRKRVIQLGEPPNRVFQVGAIGIENILNLKLLNKDELEKSIKFDLDRPYAVVTFHPSTLDRESVTWQLSELLRACERHSDLNYIFTKSNADVNGEIINKIVDEFADNRKNVIVYSSLGTVRYLSALKYCKMVIGNSSSGLIEAPSFGIPTINIGDRQKGRLYSDSVINCKPDEYAILNSIDLALSNKFQEKAKTTKNPYGDGKTSDKIVEVIIDLMMNGVIDLKKQFYNINFEVN